MVIPSACVAERAVDLPHCACACAYISYMYVKQYKRHLGNKMVPWNLSSRLGIYSLCRCPFPFTAFLGYPVYGHTQADHKNRIARIRCQEQ